MQKKLFLNALFIIFSTIFAHGQVVTTDPAFPTINSSITVYFHADQGNQGLKGYTGDVYAHTGVITNASSSNGDWKHAPSWGDNSAKYKLTRLSTDLYSLLISNVNTYYNIVDPNEKVLKLAFVFRSGDKTKEGKGTGNTDIFVDLFTGTLNVKFNKPTTKFQFAVLNGSVQVEAIASTTVGSIDKLILYKNGVEFTQVQNDTLTTTLTADQSGRTDVKVVAVNTSNDKDSSAFYYIVNPPVVNAPVPNGIHDGINKIGGNSVTFSLLAPYKKNVYLLGDFNNWEVDPAYYLKRDSVSAENVRWWIQIDNLDPNKEYAFQYLVDGTINIADPYTEKVLVSGDDAYIPASVYPNLKPYPIGKTTQAVSTFQINEPQYTWKTTNFQKPDKKNLIIYELLVRDFVATHSYQTLIDTLSYFKKLGINAIELMPVNEFEGNESWGYNPAFHFALDKYYGTKNKLKEFIDSCHANGIAVIIDLVLNHAFGQNPLVRLYQDGYYTVGNNSGIKMQANNPYFNVMSPNTTYFWGADFNHEKPATQDYIDRVNRYWMEEYKVDGFRFDFTKGFTNKSGDGWAYDQSRINILSRMADKMWEFDPQSYVILEHLAENGEEIALSDKGLMLWGNLNYNYSEASMGRIGTSNFVTVSYKARAWSKPHLVGYMESHDEERMMYRNIQYGNSTNPDHNVKQLKTALNRTKLAAALFFTVPGPKMIWQFGELGYDVSIDYNGRVGNKPIKWDYYSNADRKNLFKTFAALIKLRKENEAFSSSNYTFTNGSVAIKKLNITDPSMNVAVVGNFDVTSKTATSVFQNTGTWYDYFTGAEINVTDAAMPINLVAGEFKIFTTKKLTTPEAGIATTVEDEDNGKPGKFSLDQNYPNPFNPSTVINFSIPNNGNVSLKIFDLLGREVETLVNDSRSAGNYSVEFKASKLSSGVYIYQLKSGNMLISKKMTIVK